MTVGTTPYTSWLVLFVVVGVSFLVFAIYAIYHFLRALREFFKARREPRFDPSASLEPARRYVQSVRERKLEEEGDYWTNPVNP